MTTYKITNIVPRLENNDMIVYYEFSNGNVFSNIVPITTPVDEIMKWGTDKCTWFDERDVMIEEIQKQLLEQPVVEVVEEVITE